MDQEIPKKLPDQNDAPVSWERLSPQQRLLLSSRNRFKTFGENGWPKAFVNIGSLAEAGFFLPIDRSNKDETECIFCHVKIWDWNPTMDPFLEHQKRSPRCDFLMGYNVGNEPIDGKLSSDPIRGDHPVLNREPDVCGSSPSPSTSLEVSPSIYPSFLGPTEGSMEHQVPVHSNRVTLASRLSSFPPNWSQLCALSASTLAEAGFFYDGVLHGEGIEIQDAVKCFHCDRIICDWDPTDDPWVEHKKYKPNCYFIRLNYDERREQSPSQTVQQASSSVLQSAVAPTGMSINVETYSSSGASLEEQMSKSTSSGSDARCKVCLDNEVEILFIPCRHANCCASCAVAVTKCPYCRAEITGSVRIYLS